mgnify:CR=1 FL=1
MNIKLKGVRLIIISEFKSDKTNKILIINIYTIFYTEIKFRKVKLNKIGMLLFFLKKGGDKERRKMNRYCRYFLATSIKKTNVRGCHLI